ncbi:pleckstrin homology domain-containing family F member 1 [Brienomyrus brachyistius]|uniref:pleckstrin homology domain-containing family F member 1 n=1 Tax=Brienomyrus brachyistius TaxID=42636 RepID=UPI0020B44BA5|nr:pleckstrin homology domain-containing family F member 1 [Brienomyrus brachyistius]
MVDQLAYSEENAERIAAVDNLFSTTGQVLARPGRVLVGEGRLLKLCRRRPQAKMFFLFNDILVYGSIVVEGRWCERQKVVPLENVVLEDLDDGPELKNRWLIRTPCKSFCVSAASTEEKVAWIEHIEDCRQRRMVCTGEVPTAPLAAAWVPDQASAICMRCSSKFTMRHRRHHCRQCGFVVCSSCSRSRYVLQHISQKPVRVCYLCHQMLQMQDNAQSRDRGGSDGKDWSDDDDLDRPLHEGPGGTICWNAQGTPSSIFLGVPLSPPKTKSR